MNRIRFLSGFIAAGMAVVSAVTIPAETERKPLENRYIIIELQPVVSGTDTQEVSSVETEGTSETAAECTAETDTEDETGSIAEEEQEDTKEQERIVEIVSRTDTALLYLSEEYVCDDFSVTGIRADEPIIARLLARTDDYEGYDSIALYDIISYQPEADEGYEFILQLDEIADVFLYQITDGTLQGSGLDVLYTEDVYNRLPAVRFTSGTNHWLVISLESAEKAGSGVSEMDTNEMTADREKEEAAESLEGKTEPDQEITTASHQEGSETRSTTKAVSVTREPENTKAPETTKSPSATAPTTAAPSKPAPATAAPTTQAPTKPAPTTPAPTTAPPTTAHTHTWVPVTTTVHHDATYKQVWVEDQAAYDEIVIDQAAYDEQVLVQEAYDENVLVSEAWDEPVYGWVGICNECGHVFQAGEDIGEHMAAGCWSSWHDEWLPIGTTHHDAVYQTVHHDAVYQTVHHDAVTHVVHHDAVGHYESVLDQAAWDEAVITGYKCSECGAVQ